ncbi:MAG: DNA-binding protein [Acidiphilium sp.]|jgi:predicted transcriptional regulator|nr:DNA-binding protein [Acidiphilium sp.]
MDTLIIGNQSEQDIRRRVIEAWNGGEAEPAARLDFGSLDDAWKVLSPKRREIMSVMAGVGPLTLREIARRVHRDVRAVHSDVHTLLRSGVIDKTDDDRLVLPYRFVKFDFMLDSQRAA